MNVLFQHENNSKESKGIRFEDGIKHKLIKLLH